MAEIKNTKTLVKDFIDYLKNQRNLEGQTIKNYQFYIERFFDWSKLKSIQNLSEEKIDQYTNWLESKTQQKDSLKDSTRNYHLIALRSFLSYLQKNSLPSLAPEKVKLNKIEKKDATEITNEQIEKILKASTISNEPELIRFRDRAILELLFSTGMKVSEVSNLKRVSLNLEKNEIKQDRKIILSNQAKFWLKKYLDRCPVNSFVFVRHDRASQKSNYKNITSRSIQRVVEKYNRLAGIKTKITPNTIRQNFLKRLINQEEDIDEIKQRLGYSRLTNMDY